MRGTPDDHNTAEFQPHAHHLNLNLLLENPYTLCKKRRMFDLLCGPTSWRVQRRRHVSPGTFEKGEGGRGGDEGTSHPANEFYSSSRGGTRVSHPANGRVTATPPVARRSTSPLSPCPPVQLWLGYQQSLRPCQAGLALNVDIACTAFLEEVPVPQYLAKGAGVFNIGALAGAPDFQKKKAAKSIIGIKVFHPPPPIFDRKAPPQHSLTAFLKPETWYGCLPGLVPQHWQEEDPPHFKFWIVRYTCL